MIKQPSYRFVGFEDEWKEVKVSDIFRVTRGQVLATTQISEEKTDTYKYPVYSSQTKNEGLLGYYDKYLFETAITWTTDGANAGTVNYREGKFYSTNVNGVLLSDEGFANKVIAEILNNEAWKYVSKVGNPKLMNNVMSEISLVIPNDFREISILSTFFQDIDHLITLQQRKLEVLKEQKKTYLKLLFPAKGQTKPALRFAGFEDDWKEVKLGEAYSFSQGQQVPVEEQFEQINENRIRFIRIVDLTNKGEEMRYIEFKSSTGRVYEKDIFFVRYGAVGVVGIGYDGIIANNLFRLNPQMSVDNKFMYVQFNREKFKKTLQGFSASTTMPAISFTDIRTIDIYLPSLPEQTAIGSFFQELDKVIAKQEEKVNQLKESKQTLLRKMFI
ncbi:restriction endonuclease subunit S [Streptococcus pseudopneumoniae]|uniref:restriction endonuclease subunit S n=1 Tax=Streptococcus pseudopneumoniae TaxID=257758 RepID=UPI00110C0EDF|nr:restriction endonuclease subunit S [Streptococcus pseudopneumoniae]TMR61457.1 restriction endonuclease subunit S [Streptococcus pseudopneumoniae]